MRSIDIRSEPAVRLLSDFLDVRGSEGRERKGTEHFLHGEILDEGVGGVVYPGLIMLRNRVCGLPA
jgi:hypothetical protein